MTQAQQASDEVRGWKDIAGYLGVSVKRAQDRANRNRDPLPVFVGHRGPWAYRSALRDWVARQNMAYQAHRQLNRLRVSTRGDAGRRDDSETHYE